MTVRHERLGMSRVLCLPPCFRVELVELSYRVGRQGSKSSRQDLGFTSRTAPGIRDMSNTTKPGGVNSAAGWAFAITLNKVSSATKGAMLYARMLVKGLLGPKSLTMAKVACKNALANKTACSRCRPGSGRIECDKSCHKFLPLYGPFHKELHPHFEMTSRIREIAHSRDTTMERMHVRLEKPDPGEVLASGPVGQQGR